MSHFSMVAFEGLSSAKSDQAKIEGFRAVPTYEAGAEPQPRMRSFICWEADIVLVDTAGESDPFVHDWFVASVWVWFGLKLVELLS